ncbi:MAG: class I SAM-dependent methyltransferase, partial [Acidimicrobiales bacterium]
CGEAFVGSAVARVAARRNLPIAYSGADLSAAALELAREVVDGELIVGDAIEVAAGLPAASQDVAVIKNLLHHLDDPAALLRQAARLVGPAGRVVVIEACGANPQFWVFSTFAPKREKYFFYGRRRNLAALEDAGLTILSSQRYSILPYEVAFHIRPGVFRRLLSTNDPTTIGRFSRLDDRLARAAPAFSSYIIWVTAPLEGTNRA